jgi:hypothetical protein
MKTGGELWRAKLKHKGPRALLKLLGFKESGCQIHGELITFAQFECIEPGHGIRRGARVNVDCERLSEFAEPLRKDLNDQL